MRKIQIIIFIITLTIILSVYSLIRTSTNKNVIETSPIPVTLELEPTVKNTASFTCDTDADCALGAECKESQMCPPCLTDDQGKPVGNCNCVTVKKCEPR